MQYPMLYLIFNWQILSRISLITALNESNDEMCPFEQTVNLTNKPSYDNGSILYQGSLIPLNRQRLYDYDLKFLGLEVPVDSHLRGCVCDQRSCIKLCCEKNEYFDDMKETSQCEKLLEETNISWDLPIRLANGKIKEINALTHFIYHVGLPCLQPEALIPEDEVILLENGVLFVQADNSKLMTLDYCYSPSFENQSGKYILTPFSCPTKNEIPWQLKLNTYAMAISVLFLIPTIVVYLVLKELRGNLRGKLLICYLLSLTMGYSIIAFINISGLHFNPMPCSVLGFTCYFFFMAAFLWLSVLCFDIWMNFKETNVELNSHKNRQQFIVYSIYAWLTAGLATSLLIFMQVSPHVDDGFKPGIGERMCWLNTDKWSAAIYFYGPNLIILFFNFLTFAHLTARIYNVRRNLAKMTHKEKFFQENAVVILRLFLIMGISWLFDILSYCVREYEEYDFLFVVSDFANAIQGILIFSLFVLKPNVLNLLRKRFHSRRKTGKPQRSLSSSNTHFSKLQTSISMQTAVTP